MHLRITQGRTSTEQLAGVGALTVPNDRYMDYRIALMVAVHLSPCLRDDIFFR